MTAPLSAVFRAHYRGEVTDLDEAALERLAAAARAPWPRLHVDGPTFIAYVAARLAPCEAPLVALEKLFLVDLYLACAVDVGEPRALELFERQLIQKVPLYLSGVAGAAALVDEVRQHLREHLLVAERGRETRLSEYAGTGSLEGWVRVSAVRTALNLIRGETRHASRKEAVSEPSAPSSVDPELELVDARLRPAFEAAFRAALATLDTRARTLLRLHYFEGARIGQLALAYNVHRVTLARWLAEAQEEVLARTREEVSAQLGLQPAECDSLIRAVRSRFGATLHSALRS